MLTKTRGACRQLGTWISVRLVRDDPDVLGGMYRTDTNTVFLDMGDLDSERYVAPNASAADANLANRLAKSQNSGPPWLTSSITSGALSTATRFPMSSISLLVVPASMKTGS